jgi:hypothetical protein
MCKTKKLNFVNTKSFVYSAKSPVGRAFPPVSAKTLAGSGFLQLMPVGRHLLNLPKALQVAVYSHFNNYKKVTKKFCCN